MVQLESIHTSTRRDKRFMAVFDDGTVTHFGDPTRESYPFHKDRDRKVRYMHRHKKDLNTGDMRRAGFLSWYILWGYPELDKSIETYRYLLRLVEHGYMLIPTDVELWSQYGYSRRGQEDGAYDRIMEAMGIHAWVDVSHTP